MMRNTERKLEKKRKKKEGQMGGKIGWDEDKKICPVDDKKGCLLIFYKQFIPTE
mgnify:FL=1